MVRSAHVQAPLYGTFFGLQEPPFDLSPNPRFLFLNPRQREALSNLRYGLSTHRGFSVLIGEAGTGKTTLLRAALGELSATASQYVLVSNPTLVRGEFYEFLAREFGLSAEAGASKARFLAELQRSVESRYAAGGVTGLIIDEAQSLPHELLEEIRLLGNIETTNTKLLNIVLSGQPELADRLNEGLLRQLKQRIALRCELRPLTLDETAAYISGRLRIAGGAPHEIFTRETVTAIHEISAGIPRTINVLCDNALIGGFAAQVKPVTVEIIEEVRRDFDLAVGSTSSLPAPLADGIANPASPAPRNARHESPAPEADDKPLFGAISTPSKKRFFFFG